MSEGSLPSLRVSILSVKLPGFFSRVYVNVLDPVTEVTVW